MFSIECLELIKPTANLLLHNGKKRKENSMRLKARKLQKNINFEKHAMNKLLIVLKPNENILMRNNTN